MKFIELALNGSFLIELDPNFDNRGYFMRTFCTHEFATYDLKTNFVQCNSAYNLKKGIIRGMHFQVPPHQETKLVRCTRGAIFDVIADLREESETYLQWYGIELTATNHRMLYVPKGFAHGYQTLENHSEIFYMVDEYYNPTASREIDPQNIPMLKFPLPRYIPD
jgi:dTDP-4-dehydrorhamnose 3,5-epimerase